MQPCKVPCCAALVPYGIIAMLCLSVGPWVSSCISPGSRAEVLGYFASSASCTAQGEQGRSGTREGGRLTGERVSSCRQFWDVATSSNLVGSSLSC
eukprot:1156191-Pelagomonas_calceolata.AAC.4